MTTTWYLGDGNDRGLRTWYEATDTYGTRIHVQDSSAASGASLWIFGKDMHLDADRAAALRDALTAWLREIGAEE